MSTNNGFNWSSIGIPDASIVSIAVSENYIFAGESNTQGSLYLSTDDGNNWTTLNDGNGLTAHFFMDIAINDTNVYTASGWDGIYRSENLGESWVHIPFQYMNMNTIAVSGDKV